MKAQAAASGAAAEKLACAHLRKQGLRIIETNYHSRFGEIDIIAASSTHIIFCEVRFRKNNRYGSPEESVDQKKQQRILQTAQIYLSQLKNNTLPCRFDVIAITPDQHGHHQLNWLTNAFQ
ncbi:MAG: YraN family protein [Spongiibacteraceae bacterium]